MDARVQPLFVLIAAMVSLSLFSPTAAGEAHITGVTPVDSVEVPFFTPYEESMAKLSKTTTITDPLPCVISKASGPSMSASGSPHDAPVLWSPQS